MTPTEKPLVINITGNTQLAKVLQVAFNAVCDRINKMNGVVQGQKPEPGVGVNIHRGGHQGTVIEAQPQAQSRPAFCPHSFSVENVEGSNSQIYVTVASYGAIDQAGLASNAYENNQPWKSANFSKQDTKWIRAHVETDGGVGITWEIEISNDPAPPIGVQENVPPSEFWIDLAVVIKGRLTRIIGCANLRVSSQIILVTDKEEPACSEIPTINHYTWRIQERAASS
jgi:hypothetical protein